MPAFSEGSGNPGDGEAGVCIQWPTAAALPMQPPHHTGTPVLRLGVMASGEGSNFEALVAACRCGELAAEVSLLVVNEPGCGAIDRAERLGIPHRLLDHRLRSCREQLDCELVKAFRAAAVDLVVMAGWMRIVTPVLIDAFPQRLINIHPSLLPSFRGRDGIADALKAGVTLAGCTAHLVVPEVDAGPILVQAAVPVLAGDDRCSLHERIRRQEHRILPLAVRLAAERLSRAAEPGG
ncbi:MAG: phosphoribosylglycinamide formyltransferase [Cyanobium sp.]